MERNQHILPEWRLASQLAMLRLPALVDELHARHGCMPYVGCELEWYVDHPENEAAIAATHKAVEQAAGLRNIRIAPIVPEKGNGQYEAAFTACNHPGQMAQAIHDFRALLMYEGALRGLHILWDAKPYAHDYGSALQVHVHLEDVAGARLFVKKDAYLSPQLAASLGGLLDITPAATFVAAPQESSFARFVPHYDAPVNVSWGGNNRSVALRLPLKSGAHCHIEYRLAGADAEPASMFGLLLCGVLDGLERQSHPGEQMHGVASDEQYGLPPLPSSRDEAREIFRNASACHQWMGEEWCAAVAGL
jgi:glutamine synthetase